MVRQNQQNPNFLLMLVFFVKNITTQNVAGLTEVCQTRNLMPQNYATDSERVVLFKKALFRLCLLQSLLLTSEVLKVVCPSTCVKLLYGIQH